MKEKKSGRSYTEVKESMTKNDFAIFCKNIAERYAKSELIYSCTYYTKEYNISKHCFYKLLDTAVIYNLVSDKTVEKMQLKAIKNQKRHAVQAGLSSHVHYSDLKRRRNEYIISMYSDEEIESLAEEFAYQTELTKSEFAEKNSISTIVLDLLLKKAIEEAIVDDSVFNAIKDRSMEKSTNPEEVSKFFNNLLKKRELKINELLSK